MKNDPCYLSCEASLGILSVAGNFGSNYTFVFIKSRLRYLGFEYIYAPEKASAKETK